MEISKAQTLVEHLTVMDADLKADLTGLENLALWALRRYSPMVSADPPDGLVIEIMGAAHLHGGEEPMLDGMIESLNGFGVTARIAVADTWGAAHALARYVANPISVATPGESASPLLPLPISALRLSASLVSDLRALGFRHIEDLVAQPRAPLALRFGPDLGRRLDQAFGRSAEPIDPVRLEEIIEVQRVFAEPISAAETIAKYIGKLTVQICDRLESKGLGAKRLDLLLHRTDNKIEAIRVGMARPVRDLKRLTRLLCDKIETVDPGWGIELMRLAATEAEPLNPKQMISSLIEEPDIEVTSFIDTIANRLGSAKIYSMAPVASDVPERAVKKVAPNSVAPGLGWPKHWPRPAMLLPRPSPIETMALLPDHPPVSFTWRGRRHRVHSADGPERVSGEWWKRDAEIGAIRDYFQVMNEAGERFWIFRAGDGEHMETGSQSWFLHGFFQ
ncbi:Y-family DNA polymerase [Asticcacaulis endophyticus]|nr:DNA polymerase Y family protein [Asticcacaulis endophyticus]